MSLGTILGFNKHTYTFNDDYMDFNPDDHYMVTMGESNYCNIPENCYWPEGSLQKTNVPTVNDNFNPQGYIAEGVPLVNCSSYVWLSIDDFVKEQKTNYMVVSTNRSEINSSKIYCKIPIKDGRVTFDTIYMLDDYKRRYFNPTNIDKLHIKLLEPSGIVSYIGQSNYNFDIKFTCLR